MAIIGGPVGGPSRGERVARSTMACDPILVGAWGENVPPAPSPVQFSGDGAQILCCAREWQIIPFMTRFSNQPVARVFGDLAAADLNRDGLVNGGDLAILLGAWGTTGSPADLDGDGVVGAADLAMLLGAWGN